MKRLFGIRIRASAVEELEAHAAETGHTPTTIATEIVEQWLKEHPPSNEARKLASLRREAEKSGDILSLAKKRRSGGKSGEWRRSPRRSEQPSGVLSRLRRRAVGA